MTGNEWIPKVTCDACDEGKVTERRKDAEGRETLITRACALCKGTGKRQAGQ
jgi:hypothetical protein